jgi:branched-chain amino acid aminotransferase
VTSDGLPPSASSRFVELVRVRRGRVELLGEHLRRLASSMNPPPPFWSELEPVLQRVRATLPTARDGIYELSARADTIEQTESRSDGEELAGETLAAGVDVAIIAVDRAALLESAATPKTFDRLLAARAQLASVRARGVHELVRRAPTGQLVGAVRANLFLITDDGLLTPSTASGAFPGIARRATLRAARDLGVAAREGVVTESDLARASDAFLTSSALGLVAIRTLDGRPLVAPSRGTRPRALVPKLRLRLHELSGASFLPEERE